MRRPTMIGGGISNADTPHRSLLRKNTLKAGSIDPGSLQRRQTLLDPSTGGAGAFGKLKSFVKGMIKPEESDKAK